MFDIVTWLESSLNSKAFSIKEILYEFSCSYKISKEQLPASSIFLQIFKEIPNQDDIVINFSSDGDIVYAEKGKNTWIDEYKQLIDDLYSDEICIEITIRKKICNGVLNIYNLIAFQKFLAECTFEANFKNFTKLFDECGEHVAFRLLDTNGSLRTKSISFSDKEIQWSNSEKKRAELIQNCDDASIFLERGTIKLIPQDFTIQDPVEENKFQEIIKLFGELRNILSYVYLANTASVQNDRVILYFDPTSIGYEYSLNSLTKNKIVAKVYDWIFKDEGCVDKASIARKIINIYCHSEEDILGFEQKIFNSIKSHFQIYQKDHAEQYIDMKNKISDHIVDSAKQVQELTHELSDAIRNNFVAIIVFIMTALLTDSFDISKLLEKDISSRITVVCLVFTMVSLLYLEVTFLTSNEKWKWLEQAYNDLKENYKGTLDEADINEIFNNDAAFNHTKNQYEEFKKKVKILWIIAIIIMGMFTGYLFYNGNLKSVINSGQNKKIITELVTEECTNRK